jgi:Na+-transporting methylmalonyl-CoA/oxaloacetate decarboxylase beta subunit
MGVTVAAASLLNPSGALWGAAATFGASYGLVAATNIGTGQRNAATLERMGIVRNRGWIVAGLASLFVVFFILGPGIPRSG